MLVRKITYAQALNEAVSQMMKRDSSVIVLGEGVDYKKAIFGSTAGLAESFGANRVIDTPISEDAITGICIGLALEGMRPIMVHARVDFVMLAMNQIVNHAAKWSYMCGGAKVPIVIRAIIGCGWGQGAQHAQSLQSLFAHIPGLKVIMPASPYDIKGMMISAIKEDSPVICIEHRLLYGKKGIVPKEIYQVPIGKAKLVKEGDDITIVAVSYMVYESLAAAAILADYGINAEVIDLRSVRPIDKEMICESVKKTGRLIIADTDWKICGVSAEVAAIVAENLTASLKSNIIRITLPEYPAPTSRVLEKEYYPGPEDIIEAGMKMFGRSFEKKEKKGLKNKPFEGAF